MTFPGASGSYIYQTGKLKNRILVLLRRFIAFLLSLHFIGNISSPTDIVWTDLNAYIETSCVDLSDGTSDSECLIIIFLFRMKLNENSNQKDTSV